MEVKIEHETLIHMDVTMTEDELVDLKIVLSKWKKEKYGLINPDAIDILLKRICWSLSI